MTPLEQVRRTDGMRMVNRDGEVEHLRLSPPLSGEEFIALQGRIPCPLPAEARELFAFARGFENGPVESVDFSGLLEFGMEEIFHCAVPIAHDGYGNYWVVDLNAHSSNWAPVWFVCHDPWVLVFQSGSLVEFIDELLRLGNPPYESKLDFVRESAAFSVWKDLSRMRPAAEFLQAEDAAVRDFAAELGSSWLIADLRNANPGDGYPWGRFGPRTTNRRMGAERVFAIRRKSVWDRLLGR